MRRTLFQKRSSSKGLPSTKSSGLVTSYGSRARPSSPSNIGRAFLRSSLFVPVLWNANSAALPRSATASATATCSWYTGIAF